MTGRYPITPLVIMVLSFFVQAEGLRAGPSDARPQADAALSSAINPMTLLNQPTVNTVVTPYSGTNPPETSVTGTSVTTDIINRRSSATMESRALNATEGSFLMRPKVTFAPGTPIFDSSNSAIANANSTVGGYFDPASGLCNYSDFGNVAKFTTFCTRDPVIANNSCTVDRNVSVDRHDVWNCSTSPSDTCTALAASPSCSELHRACALTDATGACIQEDVTYGCVNELATMAPATLTDTQWKSYDTTPTGTCDVYQADANCQMASTTCSTGPQTRTINGQPVSRVCWGWDQQWDCLTPATTTTCGAFDSDPTCFQSDTTCLSVAPDGSCIQEEVQYTCGVTSPTTDPACVATNVCIGNVCDGVTPPNNTQYAEAAAWLNWLDGQNSDGTLNPTLGPIDVFSGTHRFCRVGALSVLNCCQDSGWGNGIVGQCNSSEYSLIAANQAGSTVYVGTYCRRRFLVCLQRARSYCSFNSVLAKVFQVEARLQLGLSWGDPKNPDCRGLTYTEFQSLDFTSIDLSPAFADMMSKTNSPNSTAVNQQLLSQLQSQVNAVQNAYPQP